MWSALQGSLAGKSFLGSLMFSLNMEFFLGCMLVQLFGHNDAVSCAFQYYCYYCPLDLCNQLNNWVDLFCRVHRSEVSFCVGTHLIPHPNKVVNWLPWVLLCDHVGFLCYKLIYCLYCYTNYQFGSTCATHLWVFVFRKVDRGGEDAFFISSYNGGVVAVADGVSGYGALF